ncbi:hypothetical protein [Paeniglutamicibacter sp.]|uniref:hypothetical protein n=1 Tax=Paeniglutamicibacter sp. TaxID=1934391 RepID=UPI003989F86B
MSQRKHGDVVVSVPGKRSQPTRLPVSWTTRAERNREVKNAVDAWARSVRGWWGVFVDVTTLDEEAGGKVFINGDQSTAVAQFRMDARRTPVPTPVPALFAASAA